MGSSGFNVGKRAAVSLGTPSSTAAVDTTKLVTVVRAKLGELTTCYANDASSASPAKSAVLYRFEITADGKVTSPDASSHVLSIALDLCIKRVLRSMVFAPGAATIVSYPLVFDSTGTTPPSKPPGDATASGIAAWTPYALETAPPAAAAIGAARAAEGVVRARVEAIEKCFAGPSPTGSLRVMLGIEVTGELGTTRVGGLGDAKVEVCIARALDGMRVVTPTPQAVEVACDLARGDAQPWRLAPSAGYGVIEAEPTRLRHDTDTLVAGTTDPDPLPAGSYVVLAQRATSGAMLQLALMWAHDANPVIFALHDGSAAPLFLGIGHAGGSANDDDDSDAIRPALRVTAKTVTGCVSRTSTLR